MLTIKDVNNINNTGLDVPVTYAIDFSKEEYKYRNYKLELLTEQNIL